MSNDILQTKETDLWRCTVCGRVGTVGRCCGEETRERVNMEHLLAENERLRAELERLEAIVEHFDPYMGDNECRPMENARFTITILRDRLGKGMDVF